MRRKRTKSIAEREHKKSADNTEIRLGDFDPNELKGVPERAGLSERIEDYGYDIKDAGMRARAEELEHRSLFNSILLTIIERHPSKTGKSDYARLNDVHTAMFGKKPIRGRPPSIDQAKMDEIARKFFKAWMLEGSDTSLDKIIIDVVAPGVRGDFNPNKTAEDRIKRYRKVFNRQEEWLLARISLMLDATEDFKDGVEAATDLMLELSKSFSK